jgi:hypothetical protein
MLRVIECLRSRPDAGTGGAYQDIESEVRHGGWQLPYFDEILAPETTA